MDWRDYWNGHHPRFANQRHKVLHYRALASEFLALIKERFADDKPVVLDYGCGESLDADLVAARCARLYLADTAPTVVELVRRRFAADSNITAMSAEDVAGMRGGSVDLIVVNSVVQYLSRPELDALLELWRSKLSQRGWLVLADIIPPTVGPLTDTRALLEFAARGGFLIAASGSLVRTNLSGYRKLCATLGITRYSEEQMLRVLHEANFNAQRRLPNLGHNPARLCFAARWR
ncbi:MAG: methyltransferase domain-containing protein [Steroidobacteraceae bacterium]